MYAKTISPFAFNKISLLLYEKYSHGLMGFEALDYISVHKKYFPPPPQSSANGSQESYVMEMPLRGQGRQGDGER